MTITLEWHKSSLDTSCTITKLVTRVRWKEGEMTPGNKDSMPQEGRSSI